MSRSNRPPSRTFERLNLEPLETRDNPAGYWWLPGANSDFLSTTAGNWSAGPGGVPYAIHTEAPNWDDDLYFQGDLTQAWCTIPETGTPTNPYGVAFNSINLLFGEPLEPEPGPIGSPPPPPVPGDAYWGTVTLADSFAVRDLVVDCGYINQADPTTLALSTAAHAGTLTVTTALDWTGGTLNSNTTAGYIDLAPGSISTAEPSFTNPGINGTVFLGSTLTLKGTEPNLPGLGSTLNVLSGTYKLLRDGADFVVGSGSTINMEPVPKPPQDPPTTPGLIRIDGENKTKHAKRGGLEVEDGGTAIVKAKDRPANNFDSALVDFTGTVSKLDNAGTVILKDYAWMRFTHTDEEMPALGGFIQANEESNPINPKEKLLLEAGSKITCRERAAVQILNGVLEMTEKRDSAGDLLETQPDVEIVGSNHADVQYALWIEMNTRLRAGAGRSIPIKLAIWGKLQWSGDIELYADHTAYRSDEVVVSNRILVDNEQRPFGQGKPDPKLKVAWFNAAQGEPVTGLSAWDLVVSNFVQPPGEENLPIDKEPKYEAPPKVGNLEVDIKLNTAQSKIQMKKKAE